ncbi:hypothetical protein KBH77_02060 [Patescibacteria group bacterium]|nr:hypothetical protein [Patescibacteria group bacterium]
MKYGKISLGQIEALVNDVGGEVGVSLFLKGKISISCIKEEDVWERISNFKNYQTSNIDNFDISQMPHDQRYAILDQEEMTIYSYTHVSPDMVIETIEEHMSFKYHIYIHVIG